MFLLQKIPQFHNNRELIFFRFCTDEFFNDGTTRVNKSSSPTNNSTQPDTLPSTNTHPTSEPTTPTNVYAEENNDNQAEFTNPFYTSIQENAESSSRKIGNSNVHTFNQPQDSASDGQKITPLTNTAELKTLREQCSILQDKKQCRKKLID
ncbi:hypothetical protein Tco_1429122 [Tanacetum coccineum]